VIVADRFHVIRLINHHFLAIWREIDPVASKHRGLISLMRRRRHDLRPNTSSASGPTWPRPALAEAQNAPYRQTLVPRSATLKLPATSAGGRFFLGSGFAGVEPVFDNWRATVDAFRTILATNGDVRTMLGGLK
jgi:hypothetical protein